MAALIGSSLHKLGTTRRRAQNPRELDSLRPGAMGRDGRSKYVADGCFARDFAKKAWPYKQCRRGVRKNGAEGQRHTQVGIRGARSFANGVLRPLAA